ncbi:Serine protein kinase [Venustampulla echinocandica]|uniref:Serine protein kinase n=1 Tax=Venustampulla echinocandica TaxID=2656787 RepID=A0A370TZ46_9HELO|nr:Serine protein kinase [Venustampulla echinocandica]RDL40784.1 Serine protein kinase [Venustampulla echinocandica]
MPPDCSTPSPAQNETNNPVVGSRLTSESGRQYSIECVLQEKDHRPEIVYIASRDDGQKFVLKDLPPSIFKLAYDMQRTLITQERSPYLRLMRDIILEQSILIYDYATDHLLSFAQKQIPLAIRKRILGDALHVKENNILVNYENVDGKIVVKSVQLGDLEDAAYVPPGSDIVGSKVGNQLWRSPEAHAQGPVNSPSDMFSFGIIVMYIRPFPNRNFCPQEMEDPEMEPLSIILERQLSYFAEPDTFDTLLRHLGPESPWCEILTVVRSGFNEQNRRKPFRLWKVEKPGFDQDFMDLVGRMTNFDLVKRITAREALAHKWFADVEC